MLGLNWRRAESESEVRSGLAMCIVISIAARSPLSFSLFKIGTRETPGGKDHRPGQVI